VIGDASLRQEPRRCSSADQLHNAEVAVAPFSAATALPASTQGARAFGDFNKVSIGDHAIPSTKRGVPQRTSRGRLGFAAFPSLVIYVTANVAESVLVSHGQKQLIPMKSDSCSAQGVHECT